MSFYASDAERLEINRILRSCINLKEIVLRFKPPAEAKLLLTKNSEQKAQVPHTSPLYRHHHACPSARPESGCCSPADTYLYLTKDLDTFESVLKEATSDLYLDSVQDSILKIAAEKHAGFLAKLPKQPQSDDERRYILGEFLTKTVQSLVHDRIKELLQIEDRRYNQYALLAADPKSNTDYFGERIGPIGFGAFQKEGWCRIDRLLGGEALEAVRAELDWVEKLNLFDRCTVSGVPGTYLDYCPQKVGKETREKFGHLHRFVECLLTLPHFVNYMKFSGLRVAWQARVFCGRELELSSDPETARTNQVWGHFYMVVSAQSSVRGRAIARFQGQGWGMTCETGDGVLLSSRETWEMRLADAGKGRVFIFEVSLHSGQV